jgi:hypothetical protein
LVIAICLSVRGHGQRLLWWCRRLGLGVCLLIAILVTAAASITTAGRRGKAGVGNLEHLEHRLTLPPGFVATQYLPQVQGVLWVDTTLLYSVQ